MDDFVVYGELTASIIDDQYTNAATTVGKGVVESRPKPTLIDDRKTLLYITGLGHGNNAAVVANVQDAVLLEDGAKHVLNDDRGRRIGDKA